MSLRNSIWILAFGISDFCMQHTDLTVRLVQLGTAIHIQAYRLLRGHVPGKWFGEHCLLLTTHGRKSGKQRVSPLVFVRDGDDYVIVASWGGSDSHPHWFLNLRANPRVTVEVHGTRLQALATTVEAPAVYKVLWQRLCEVYPGYRMYQERTTRRIPIVRLSPVR